MKEDTVTQRSMKKAECVTILTILRLFWPNRDLRFSNDRIYSIDEIWFSVSFEKKVLSKVRRIVY